MNIPDKGRKEVILSQTGGIPVRSESCRTTSQRAHNRMDIARSYPRGVSKRSRDNSVQPVVVTVNIYAATSETHNRISPKAVVPYGTWAERNGSVSNPNSAVAPDEMCKSGVFLLTFSPEWSVLVRRRLISEEHARFVRAFLYMSLSELLTAHHFIIDS